MNFTISDLLRSTYKRTIGFEKLTPATRFKNVSTDSRTIKKGDLFIALRGENFDGHTYLAQIQKAGAIAAIVDERFYTANKKKLPKGLPLLVVTDTSYSYGELANIYRKKFSIPILAVAGSNGKTTTKDVLSFVLGASFKLLKTEANYNNHVGLPRMLFQLNPSHELAVLEIGTNHPGEIARLIEIAEPTHGIITNIGREHLEFFKNLAGVAKEEQALFEGLLKTAGVGFVNLDDKYLQPFGKKFGARASTYSTKTKADVICRSKGLTKNGKHLIEVEAAGKAVTVRTNLLAEYAPSLVAAVISVAFRFGIKMSVIKKRLEEYQTHSKRMEIMQLDSGVVVINDCYNANPESFEAAMQTLKNLPAKGKKYVVAGDMFELGDRSKTEHTALGNVMASYNFNGYYFTGEAMKNAFKKLKSTKPKASAIHLESKADIAMILGAVLSKGDVILLKGSRGMKMEQILDLL